jgi:DNA-binding LacI/PurR family transcriptional regulator
MSFTINDIAARAGVSKATVSRVLSGSPKVNAQTRARIQRLIEALGYEPSYLARSLSTKRTNTVGVIIDELPNVFFMEIAAAVEAVLREEGYTMMLSSSNWDEKRELGIVRNMIRNRVAGVILAPVSVSSQAVLYLRKQDAPFVLLNCHSDDPEIPSVSADNHAGGRIAADFLFSEGFDQIVLVTGFEHQSLADRVNGFLQRCEELAGARAGTTIQRYRGVRTWREGYSAASDLLARNRILEMSTCLFVTNDNVAMGVLAGLIDLGIRVPQQVSVMGYDDIRYASRYEVPLTTIRQPEEAMGRIAARELLGSVREPGRERRSYLLPVELKRRDSVLSRNPSDSPQQEEAP